MICATRSSAGDAQRGVACRDFQKQTSLWVHTAERNLCPKRRHGKGEFIKPSRHRRTVPQAVA
jgi:hypothetical protein